MFFVDHYAYCGMSRRIGEYESRSDARNAAADLLKLYRQDYPIQTLERGQQWEILEPENAVMVSDDCGTLAITESRFECIECGCEYASKDDAERCCTVFEFLDDEEIIE